MADDESSSGYENQQTLVKYDNPVLIKHPDKSSIDVGRVMLKLNNI